MVISKHYTTCLYSTEKLLLHTLCSYNNLQTSKLINHKKNRFDHKYKNKTIITQACLKYIATQIWMLSYRNAVSVEETPIWSHTAAGWGQYRCSCCHGYSQSPSTGFGTLVSVCRDKRILCRKATLHHLPDIVGSCFLIIFPFSFYITGYT